MTESLTEITVEGEAQFKAALSILFTDILSQELNTTLTSPETISLLQTYLKDKKPDEALPSMLPSLLQNIPKPVTELLKEALFCSGTLIKKLECRQTFKVGESFKIGGRKTLVQLEVLDGRLTRIIPFGQ